MTRKDLIRVYIYAYIRKSDDDESIRILKLFPNIIIHIYKIFISLINIIDSK
jgi:hypothetical protein